MFLFVDVLVCRRFGLSTFWFVDVFVVDVSVCRRFDQLPRLVLILSLINLTGLFCLDLCCLYTVNYMYALGS